MLTFGLQDSASRKQASYPAAGYTAKGKQPQQHQLGLGLSDEEETELTADDGRNRVSRWQRVKWTDNMIRLLIMAVFYIGDDCGSEGGEPPAANKKRSGAVMQKKGKWKSVSKAMMEKSFYVSPQQCEDKFNDLNKRYKRVNDILGKGTACRVVENQSLLDTMDHLSPKMKEETRKLLNSKHLFFREMCAYHNNGGGGSAGGTGGHQSPEVVAEITHNQQQQQQHHQHPQPQQQLCLHSSDGAHTTNSRNKVVRGGMHEEEDEDEDEINEDDDDDNDEDDDSDDDEDMQDIAGSGKCLDEHSDGHEDGDINHKLSSKKKQKFIFSPLPSMSSSMQQLSCELASVLQDGTKSPWEQRQWVRSRSMHLEEQQVSYQFQAFELEKQRIKWAKFSWKKEREMERMKLNNERSRLENERMVLVLRQKELELIDLHRPQRPSNKIPDLSSG